MPDVLNGLAWRCDQGDCLEWLASLPADSVDLVLTSPPYEQARLYLEGGQDLGIARGTEAWVAWLVTVCEAARRVCKGLCAFVVEGQTRDHRYSCGPLLLAADLHRRGFCLRKPLAFRRVGLPGSGSHDWLRNDWEPVLCFTRGGRLPWSDNTAMGHPPRWGPGGEMSHRLAAGTRRNQWGGTAHGQGHGRKKDGTRQRYSCPSHVYTDGRELGEDLFGEPLTPDTPPSQGLWGRLPSSVGRTPDGSKKRPSRSCKMGATSGHKDGDVGNDNAYVPPVLANPGNVVDDLYTARQVADLLAGAGDVIDCHVGGNLMGDAACHDNEAPFPERLAEFLVRSFCPEGGVVCDPFAGSGTTLAVAVKWGRRALGCDIRPSQVELTRCRVKAAEPGLFMQAEEDGHARD